MKRYFFICAILLGASLASRVASESFKGEGKLLANLAADERASYYGLQYLLGDSDKLEYLSLPTPDERAQWLERFWLSVDPTPTTDENEARSEHEQRVKKARELFRMTDPPGWDGRGEIYIRFGEPSYRAKVMGDVTAHGLTLPSQAWYYAALNMSVQFVDINLKGRFTYATPQRVSKPPGHSAPIGMRGPFEPPGPDYTADEDLRLMEAITFPYMIAELEGMKARHADENFRICMERFAALYSCDTEWQPIPLYFDVATFRGGDWHDRLEVSFEVPPGGPVPGVSGAAAGEEIELRVLVRDENLAKVASGEDCVTAPAVSGTGAAPGSEAPALVPGQIVLALEPGRYEIGIEARGLSSNRRTAYRTKVDVPAYTGSPSISDIQFASAIEETGENRRFVKGSVQVVPHPIRAYRMPSPVMFYFEIYGLGTDDEGIASYRVEYQIFPLEKRRWGPILKGVPVTISSSFETSGYGNMQPQRLSIATEELWQGPFRLDVSVTDLRTRRTAEQSATFSIVE